MPPIAAEPTPLEILLANLFQSVPNTFSLSPQQFFALPPSPFTQRTPVGAPTPVGGFPPASPFPPSSFQAQLEAFGQLPPTRPLPPGLLLTPAAPGPAVPAPTAGDIAAQLAQLGSVGGDPGPGTGPPAGAGEFGGLSVSPGGLTRAGQNMQALALATGFTPLGVPVGLPLGAFGKGMELAANPIARGINATLGLFGLAPGQQAPPVANPFGLGFEESMVSPVDMAIAMAGVTGIASGAVPGGNTAGGIANAMDVAMAAGGVGNIAGRGGGTIATTGPPPTQGPELSGLLGDPVAAAQGLAVAANALAGIVGQGSPPPAAPPSSEAPSLSGLTPGDLGALGQEGAPPGVPGPTAGPTGPGAGEPGPGEPGGPNGEGGDPGDMARGGEVLDRAQLPEGAETITAHEGEYVVNADAAQEFLPLLEAINQWGRNPSDDAVQEIAMMMATLQAARPPVLAGR